MISYIINTYERLTVPYKVYEHKMLCQKHESTVQVTTHKRYRVTWDHEIQICKLGEQ